MKYCDVEVVADDEEEQGDARIIHCIVHRMSGRENRDHHPQRLSDTQK